MFVDDSGAGASRCCLGGPLDVGLGAQGRVSEKFLMSNSVHALAGHTSMMEGHGWRYMTHFADKVIWTDQRPTTHPSHINIIVNRPPRVCRFRNFSIEELGG